MQVIEYDEAALREVAHHVTALADAEDLPAHGQAVSVRFRCEVSESKSCWCREDLRGRSPYGAPQLDVPVRLNTNENSYPLPEPR